MSIKLQSLGILFIILGIISISTLEDRLIPYLFMGVGIILSIISLIIERKQKRKSETETNP